MVRPLRIQYENAYYPVTCRRNAGQAIFSNDTDRTALLNLLERSSDTYQTQILAYVLMEMLYRYGGMNQREIRGLMGVDYSAVSVMRKRLSIQQGKDRRLSALIERVKRKLQESQK
jgi:DNA-binding MarR family transcriptional regulator